MISIVKVGGSVMIPSVKAEFGAKASSEKAGGKLTMSFAMAANRSSAMSSRNLHGGWSGKVPSLELASGVTASVVETGGCGSCAFSNFPLQMPIFLLGKNLTQATCLHRDQRPVASNF